MDEKTEGQLRVIRKVIAVLQTDDIAAWLFGGWGLDARIGRITREHGDVEFWVERVHAERSKALLVGAGATALPTQPPEESCEFTLDDVPFSTAYFDRRRDGSFSQPLGRFSDWLFPPGSFGDEPVTLDGTPALAMSVAGMLAMKEQFPQLRNGRLVAAEGHRRHGDTPRFGLRGEDRRPHRSGLSSASLGLAWARYCVQVRRRRVHQKQNPASRTAAATKMPVSVNCRGQKWLAGW
jgi:lincosamide nucleotidyltransferase A/C/D/E